MAQKSDCLREHQEIRALIRGLHEQLEPALLRRDANTSVQLLGRLGGLLNHHFGHEREGLYGRLVASKDPIIRATALRAQDDLCGLEPRVVDFIRYWTAAGRIQRDPHAYQEEAQGLFRAIGRRIGQEERELLPMLEVVG